MSVTVTPFLRQILRADATISGAAGILMAAGAAYLAPLLELPSGLLFWAGVVLFPFVALLVILSSRTIVSRLMMIDIVGINILWVALSFGILLSGAVSPNALGYAFVIAQALAVALFAALQFTGLRRSAAAAA